MDVGRLRELFRQLTAFRALYETERIDIIECDDVAYSLWDIEYLYEQRMKLAPRQREAIELFLFRDMKEREAALAMGLSPTNPIGMYVTEGLNNIITMIDSGALPRYRELAGR